jgi:hypothetical protein
MDTSVVYSLETLVWPMPFGPKCELITQLNFPFQNHFFNNLFEFSMKQILKIQYLVPL